MAEPLRRRGPTSRGGRCPRAPHSPTRLIPDTVLVDLVSDSDEEILEVVADPVEVPVARLPAPAAPEQDSDSDSEGAAERPAGAPRTLVRRRRRRLLLDPGEAPVVPVYSGKVQSSLNLIPDNSSLLKLCSSEPEDEADLTDSGSPLSEDALSPGSSPWKKKLRKKQEKEEKKVEEFADQDIFPLPQPSPRNKSRKHTEALQKLREVNKRLQDLRSCLSPKQHQRPALQNIDDEVVLVEGPVSPQSPRLFTLKIRCRADLVRLPVRTDSPLKVLMSQYEEAMGLSGQKLTFFFDGTKLSGKELPADLGLESGDLIEVWG
ncbi:NFATC2-interacting protein isoform X2 [Arvicanthis niloticus]|uniref:NFATC2-interacting protein isoform X2 n=1 Tax=Arvicanthis niloticus TaxID=61156 RepID=UPI00402B9727